MSRVLVLIELRGGNDGLNTLVPYADPAYARLRPRIGLARDRVIQLDEKLGLHDRLEPMMEAWKAGDLAIVQGVGYPDPNRSHFRSIEIWDTASAAAETLTEGWVAQTFVGAPRPAGAGVDAIVADTNLLPVAGPALRSVVMPDAEKFLAEADSLAGRGAMAKGNPALQHILAVRSEIDGAALGLREVLRRAPQPATAYGPASGFGRQLDLATRLLAARTPLVALKLAVLGFDTHNAQAPVHERLLEQLASGLQLLRSNLIAAGVWNDVLVMTYSEFGRRPRENANLGTDHGTAAPMFVLGGGIRGGLHGATPSLTDLPDEDLRFTVDFRAVYAEAARACWGRQPRFARGPASIRLVATP